MPNFVAESPDKSHRDRELLYLDSVLGIPLSRHIQSSCKGIREVNHWLVLHSQYIENWFSAQA